MGGTHKKKLRAEKAKVKLKGAKLPKGLNVTQTEFKVRKIIIRDQLKEANYSSEGQRLIPLKETLNRLKHHSSSFRLDALRSLRQAILANHPGVNSQLNEIIQSVSAISLDMDKNTRRESFKVLNNLMVALTADSIAPFFHIISSYLRCAMTHIQPALQEDSLLMLDCLLQNVPNLVAQNHEKIFQNFLEMISRVRAEGGGSSSQRFLTVNMSGGSGVQQQTSVKWRSKVLHRLHQMLHAIVEHKRENLSLNTARGSNAAKVEIFKVNEPQFYGVLRPTPKQGIDSASELSFMFSRGAIPSTTVGSSTEELTVLRSYVQHLLPLLMDAWVEVRPSPQEEAKKSAIYDLSFDAALTLKIVLEIVEDLWYLTDIHESEVHNQELSLWFQQEYGQKFASMFMYGFPYQQTGSEVTDKKNAKLKRKLSTTPENEIQLCIAQNLSLAHLMSRFFTRKSSIRPQSRLFMALLEYLIKVVRRGSSLRNQLEQYRSLDLALRAYLLLNGKAFVDILPLQLKQLLQVTLKAFLSNALPSQEGIAERILLMLLEILQRADLWHNYGVEEFQDFLIYLPQLLLKQKISMPALIAMGNLAKQKNEFFLQALEAQMNQIIENLSRIQVVGAYNAFEGRKLILNLFYWLDKTGQEWSEDKKQELSKKIESNIKDKRVSNYLLYILIKA